MIYLSDPPPLQLYLFIPLDALQWLLRSILVILQLRTHSEPQDHIDYEENDPLDEETTPAQVLWMKSLTRLRTQVRKGVWLVGVVWGWWVGKYIHTVEPILMKKANCVRSQMNSLCTKQPLNKGHLCIKAKTLCSQRCPL